MTENTFTAPTESDLDRAETILVVEDEPNVRRVVGLTLEMQGYRVLSAENADHALRLVASERASIDLLLADVILPGMSGPRLYEKLQAANDDLRVLFISGYDDEVLSSHAVTSSDVDFLAKPFSSAMLSRKVRQLLRISPREQQHHRHCAD